MVTCVVVRSIQRPFGWIRAYFMSAAVRYSA